MPHADGKALIHFDNFLTEETDPKKWSFPHHFPLLIEAAGTAVLPAIHVLKSEVCKKCKTTEGGRNHNILLLLFLVPLHNIADWNFEVQTFLLLLSDSYLTEIKGACFRELL